MRDATDDKTLDAFGFPMSSWIPNKPKPAAADRAKRGQRGIGFRARERLKRKAQRWAAKFVAMTPLERACIWDALENAEQIAERIAEGGEA